MNTLSFDGAFQERVVRLLFQERGFAEVALEHLPPKVFDNPVHGWFVKKLRSAHQQGIAPDILYLRQERRKDVSLGLLKKADQGAYIRFIKHRLRKPVPNRTYVKKELQDFVYNQRVKEFILDAVDKKLPQRQWDEMKKGMVELVDFNISGEDSIGQSPGNTIEKRIRAREEVKEDGITTGIAELDRLMVRGGLTPKQLGTCIAPTGRGKTNFLINLAAEAVLEGVPTLYITLELDEDTILTRMDARFTGVPIRLLRSNVDEVRRAWKKVKKRVTKNLVVKEMPPGTTTVAHIKQHIRRLERRGFYPKLLVIDYADLLKPRIEFADSSYETQGQVYLDILGLLAELKMIGWTATQGNRKSMDADTDGDVDLSMMADSVKKAFLAYVVVGIAQSEKEKKLKKARLALLKNRNGPSDRHLKLAVEHDIVTFRSLK